MSKYFDTTPDPQFLRAMQNQSWSVGGALSELVDNSFGSGRGNADRVDIVYNTRKRTIVVFDDGQGMDAVGRLFKLGNTIGRSPKDIGEYGSGGTMALLWLASKVTVWTMRDGMVNYDTVEWAQEIAKKRFPQVSNAWIKATPGNTPMRLFEAGQGTLIHLTLAQKRTFYTSNVQRDLAQTYAPGIRLGKEIVWTTIGKGGGSTVLSDPIVMPDDPNKMISFDVPFKVGDEDLSVSGKIGLVKDLPWSKSRVAVAFGPRVILRTRDCYQSPDGNEQYAGTGITGYLDLGDGWQPRLSTTKDRMDDEYSWDLLMGIIFDLIRPLLVQVEQEELYLELEELAVDLQEALNGRFSIEVENRPKATMPTEIVFGPDQGGTHEKSDKAGEGDPVKAKTPARTRILITPQSDEQMETLLCRADLRGNDTIVVMVNKDHEIVQEALKARPVNRMALNMMTTREIASEIVKDDDLLKRMFSRHAYEAIEARKTNGGGEAQFVARLLIDQVHAPSRK
jgi:Histidine kinase-, DNA gyrase B-, and HSP90-like ATPase